jgi:gas vesicle protein
MSAAKMTAAILGAAAIGAGVALLYAPQSGEETRRQMRYYAKRAQLEAGRFGRNMKNKFNKALENGKALVAA